MNYVLENSEKPKSVYHFTKLNDFTEQNFTRFGTIESIEKKFSKCLLRKQSIYCTKKRNTDVCMRGSKMLSFYFTFFEILTANRSYVVMVLKNTTIN
jgi:hypothetical protein